MLHKLDITRYNADGQQFIKQWLSGSEILGVKHINKGRYEDMLFYKSRIDGEIRIAAIPQAHESSKACFWGSLDHLVKVTWANVYGYRDAENCRFIDPRNCKRIKRAINNLLNQEK